MERTFFNVDGDLTSRLGLGVGDDAGVEGEAPPLEAPVAAAVAAETGDGGDASDAGGGVVDVRAFDAGADLLGLSGDDAVPDWFRKKTRKIESKRPHFLKKKREGKRGRT